MLDAAPWLLMSRRRDGVVGAIRQHRTSLDDISPTSWPPTIWTKAENSSRPDALRGFLPIIDQRAGPLHLRPDPLNILDACCSDGSPAIVDGEVASALPGLAGELPVCANEAKLTGSRQGEHVLRYRARAGKGERDDQGPVRVTTAAVARTG